MLLELRQLRSEAPHSIKLRNYLPRLVEASEAVDMLEHLRTPDKVSYLVEKFDEQTQYDCEYWKKQVYR